MRTGPHDRSRICQRAVHTSLAVLAAAAERFFKRRHKVESADPGSPNTQSSLLRPPALVAVPVLSSKRAEHGAPTPCAEEAKGHTGSRGCFAACAMSVLAAVACASAQQPRSPALVTRCSDLYDVWWKYDEDPVFFGLAEKSYAELALYGCQKGRYAEGIRVLERLLRQGGFNLPSMDTGAPNGVMR